MEPSPAPRRRRRAAALLLLAVLLGCPAARADVLVSGPADGSPRLTDPPARHGAAPALAAYQPHQDTEQPAAKRGPAPAPLSVLPRALLTLGLLLAIPPPAFAATSSASPPPPAPVIQPPPGNNGPPPGTPPPGNNGPPPPPPVTAPEPASLVTAFIGSGLAALLALARRRKRAVPA